ncbi:head decoration protein [uncultured Roseibium sp.]|uniref:head decoration protein n=1 Tax=uncultured Roseibium sp. TaxID=1936171 RepID=UPI00263489F9|nr:head decoration protein [uncultured Roseibium sp.]
MTVLTQDSGPGSCLISEGHHGYSRETGSVVVPAEAVYKPSTVLGQVTATKAFVQYDPAAVDGSQTVAAILLYRAEGTSDKTLITRHAQVKASELVWFDGATPAQIATGQGQLADLGIIAR